MGKLVPVPDILSQEPGTTFSVLLILREMENQFMTVQYLGGPLDRSKTTSDSNKEN